MARPEKNIDENLLLDLYSQGYTCRELAKQFGISASTVSARVNKYYSVKTSLVVKRELRLK